MTLPRRSLLLSLFVLALALRIAVPSGWMPVLGADGAIVLAPCPAAAPVKPDGHEGHHASPSDKDDPAHSDGNSGDCAFAPLAAGVDLWDAPQPALWRVASEPQTRLRARTAFEPRGPPAPPPPATGPPLTA